MSEITDTLKMPLQFLKQTITPLARAYGLRFVILHGSQATGMARGDSDIDIAVLPAKPLQPRQVLSLGNELDRVFGTPNVDCKSLDRTDAFFRYQVVKHGLLLVGDPTGYEEFKAYARRAYDDTKSLRALEQVLIQKSQQHFHAQYA